MGMYDILGLSPLPQEVIDEIEASIKEQLAESPNIMPGGFGRPKGSKNLRPYPMTDAVKSKLAKLNEAASVRHLGKIWVTDGKHSKLVCPDAIPEGFVKGRMMKNTTPEYKEAVHGV